MTRIDPIQPIVPAPGPARRRHGRPGRPAARSTASRPSGIDDPTRNCCPYRRGPYRKAWVQGWWAHRHRQPKVCPIWMYQGFIRAWQAGWQHFDDTNQLMDH